MSDNDKPKTTPRAGEFWFNTSAVYRIVDVGRLEGAELAIVLYHRDPEKRPMAMLLDDFLDTYKPWPVTEESR